MILYTNGTGHTAGAMAVNSYSQANEDPRFWNLEDRPHPDNIKVTWGSMLAAWVKMGFHTEARVNQCNEEIIENTKKWLETRKPSDVFVIIQWAKFNDLDQDWRKIKTFYEYLNRNNYSNFLFFNGEESFVDIPEKSRYTFNERYIDPYLPEGTFPLWLSNNGYDTVITSNEYFGAEAHSAWAKKLLNYIIKHKLI